MGTPRSEPILYLICHKVSGNIAFDIAHKLQIGDELGWIVETSGHRAYPIRWWQLDDLADVSDYPHDRPYAYEPPTQEWDALPDHYETKADLRRAQEADLFSALGFKRPAPTLVTRRV